MSKTDPKVGDKVYYVDPYGKKHKDRIGTVKQIFDDSQLYPLLIQWGDYSSYKGKMEVALVESGLDRVLNEI